MIKNDIEENVQENQLLVSFELICLLRWILENEDEKIKKIITRALNSGLQEEINKKTILSKDAMLYDIHSVLLDFFDMMEILLVESIGEHAIKRVIEKNLMPSIDKIDSSVCDDATVRFSIEKVASKLDNSCDSCKIDDQKPDIMDKKNNNIKSKRSSENNSIETGPNTTSDRAKKILMTELLKRWKPKEKNVIN